MQKQKVECVQLGESSEEEEEYIELPNVEDPSAPTTYKSFSDNFQVIDCTTIQVPQLIETSKGSIILEKQQLHLKVFTAEDWKDYFELGEKINVIFHSNAVHSVIMGLDSNTRSLYWNYSSQIGQENTALNKHPNLNPHKYDQAIQESLAKLQKRYVTIGYSLLELKAINEQVSKVLSSYATKDPEVGYERGMEFIAFGIVDCAFSSQKTCEEMGPELNKYMNYIMKKLQFRGFYLPSKPAVFSKSKKLQIKIKEQLPSIYQKLELLNTEFHKLFFKYYLSLFLHDTPQRVLVSRVIQLLLLEGQDFVTYFIVRILSQTQKQILSIPMEKLEFHMTNNLFKHYFSNTNPGETLSRLESLMIKKTYADCE